MKLDLIYSMPQQLADNASLDDLLETVSSIDTWQQRHAEVLDYIYLHRVIQLLRNDADEAALSALNKHLAQVAAPGRKTPLNTLGKHYHARWHAYRDMLESRLSSHNSEGPTLLMQREHVPEILQLVIKGASEQKEIQEQLGLKKANLSRILKMMEAQELIRREKHGRTNFLLPGVNALKVTGSKQQAATEDSSNIVKTQNGINANNGASYLSLVA